MIYICFCVAFNDSEKKNKLGRATSDAMAEGNIESMLAVEKGLRELASIKVLFHLEYINFIFF